MRTLLITVCQGLRGAVRSELEKLGYIDFSGYTQGSTQWEFLLVTDSTVVEVQDHVWSQFPSIWLRVEEAEEEQPPEEVAR